MRCAVLGSPIAHSLSPALHRAAYRELGLDWEYDAVEVSAGELADFVSRLDATWRGLSLTMPLKRAVMPLLDDVSPTAELTGAANTMLREPDGRRVGDNTDVPGMVRAIRERTTADITSAAILGGGATATATVVALSRLGCRRYALYVRDPARAAETATVAQRLDPQLDVEVLRMEELSERAVDLTVSTIPAAAQPPYAEIVAASSASVFDVIYEPWPTPLAQTAWAAGKTVIGGLDLLVHQATGQVELMTGCASAPVEAMRQAGLDALSRQP